MTSDPTPVSTPVKPAKPWPDFPLFWHQRGYWCVKRGGKQIPYTADWKGSYDRFRADEKARQAGEIAPSASVARYVLRDAINAFLGRQLERMSENVIGQTQFLKYRVELQTQLPKVIGLNTRLADFAHPDHAPVLFKKIRLAARARGLQVAQRHITYVRAMLAYANNKRLMPPADYGDEFDKPHASEVWRERNSGDAIHGGRAWSTAELRTIIDGAKAQIKRSPHLYVQILLGLFCGFGSGDISALPVKAVDFDKRLVRFPRVKNGRQRLCPMPAELVEAMRDSFAKRGKPVDAKWDYLFFISESGHPCNHAPPKVDEDGVPSKVKRNDTIGRNFYRLVEKLNLSRRKTGFYTLRAMFRSLAVGVADPDLIAVIMGRRFAYPVDDYYLRADLRAKLFGVVEHVRQQVFTQTASQSSGSTRGGGGTSAGRKR